MIESRKGPFQDPLLGEGGPPDATWVESQIGILKSQDVAAHIVKQLHLADDPIFANSDAGLLDRALALFGWGNLSEPRSEAQRINRAIAEVSSNLDARRIGQSYMIRISLFWHDPEQAVKIANSVIDAYIFEQLSAKYQANRRAGDWLEERLLRLREQASAAERAVIEFKAKNNIVAAGGTLMNDKQLSEISGQLAAARSQTADLQARLERIEAVRGAYQQDRPASAADESVAEAMSSGIITSLRTRYLDLVNREAEWSARYGKNHSAVVNLRNQIRDVRKSIHDELGRIEQTTRSEYEIAKRRQDELEKRQAALVSQSTETSQAQIALFSLEAAAQSYRKIYDSFLQRHTESVQQQSFPISDARPITPASLTKSGPQIYKIWMTTILAGGLLGFGIGGLRELLDRRFRTRGQVLAALQTECLGLVPRLSSVGSRKVVKRALSGTKAISSQSVGDSVDPRSIRPASALLRSIIDAPSSPYADAIRSIKLALELNNESASSRVIGLTSCFSGEGKSTIAAAMAEIIAQRGASVILVDCDLRNPSLSRTLAPDAKSGFLEALRGEVALADAVWKDATTGMAFLPTATLADMPNPGEVLASAAAKSFFVALQIEYDCVIVDLAPLLAPIDVRAALRLIDSYILVIEWGRTKVDAVQYVLNNTPGMEEKLAGAVLNKVDMNVLKRYDSYGAKCYYSQNRHAGSMN